MSCDNICTSTGLSLEWEKKVEAMSKQFVREWGATTLKEDYEVAMKYMNNYSKDKSNSSCTQL